MSWGQFEEESGRLAALVEGWASCEDRSAGASELGAQSMAIANHLVTIMEELNQGDQDSASQITILSQALAPIQDAMSALEEVLEGEDSPLFSRLDTVAIGVAVATAACRPALLALQRRDETFPSVPFFTIHCIIDSVRFLRPLAEFHSGTPLEVFPAAGPGPAFYLDAMLDLVQSSLAVQRALLAERPEVATQGEARMVGTAAALWALAPEPLDALCRVGGLSHVAARALFFKWAETYSAFHSVAVRFELPIPQRMVAALPVAGRILSAAALAAGEAHPAHQELAGAEADPAEPPRAWAAVETHAMALLEDVIALARAEDHPRRDAHLACLSAAADPGNVALLCRSVAHLRSAAAAAPSAAPAEFPLHADLLGLYAAAIEAYCIDRAAGAAPADAMRARCSPHFADCVQLASSCWVGLVRRAAAAPSFDLWDALTAPGRGLFGLLSRVVLVCGGVGEAIREMFASGRSAAAADPRIVALLEVPGEPLVGAVRALAHLAAALPASIAAGEARAGPGRSGFFGIARRMAASLKVAALGYANAALFSRNGEAPAEAPAGGAADRVCVQVAEAAHACLHAALALHGSLEAWAPRGDAPGGDGGGDPRFVVLEWYQVATMVAGAFGLEARGGAPVAALVLHGLAVLGCLPGEVLAAAAASIRIHSAPMVVAAAAGLHPALLPGDVDGLEAVLRHGQPAPGVVGVLEELVAAADSTEGLEERARRRLDLLGRLPPGVCANFWCAEAFPDGGRFTTCSGCRMVRYCGHRCAMVGWKHGHRAACQAVQAERGGG